MFGTPLYFLTPLKCVTFTVADVLNTAGTPVCVAAINNRKTLTTSWRRWRLRLRAVLTVPWSWRRIRYGWFGARRGPRTSPSPSCPGREKHYVTQLRSQHFCPDMTSEIAITVKNTKRKENEGNIKKSQITKYKRNYKEQWSTITRKNKYIKNDTKNKNNNRTTNENKTIKKEQNIKSLKNNTRTRWRQLTSTKSLRRTDEEVLDNLTQWHLTIT